MLDQSQKDVSHTVQCHVYVPRGAEDICFIGEPLFSCRKYRHEQKQQAVNRESPQRSVSTRMPWLLKCQVCTQRRQASRGRVVRAKVYEERISNNVV